MWWRLLFSHFFLQLLRFLLIPAVALILGTLVLLTLAVITYLYIIANTLQMIPQNPLLGITLLLLEIALFIGIAYGLYRGYLLLKEKVQNKLREENR